MENCWTFNAFNWNAFIPIEKPHKILAHYDLHNFYLELALND